MQKIYVKPKDCWMNDPNGFIYFKGLYHLLSISAFLMHRSGEECTGVMLSAKIL